jgi:hypothetical protein
MTKQEKESRRRDATRPDMVTVYLDKSERINGTLYHHVAPLAEEFVGLHIFIPFSEGEAITRILPASKRRRSFADLNSWYIPLATLEWLAMKYPRP